MTRDELLELITEVQQRQSELDDVEVKLAQGGTPQQLYEPLFKLSIYCPFIIRLLPEGDMVKVL